MKTEVLDAARRVEQGRLWLLVPSGSEGHWSAMVTRHLRQAPDALREAGCAAVKEIPFGQTKLVECLLPSGSGQEVRATQ